MQSSVTMGQVQYSRVNITGESIPIWGICHKRIGNNVILMDEWVSSQFYSRTLIKNDCNFLSRRWHLCASSISREFFYNARCGLFFMIVFLCVQGWILQFVYTYARRWPIETSVYIFTRGDSKRWMVPVLGFTGAGKSKLCWVRCPGLRFRRLWRRKLGAEAHTCNAPKTFIARQQ